MDRKTILLVSVAVAISLVVSEYRRHAVINQIAANAAQIDAKIGAAAKRDVEPDAYLGLPVYREQVAFAPRFIKRVRYTGNVFNPHVEDAILMLRSLTPRDKAVIWSEGFPLKVGDELDVQDDQFHDLHAGTTFVKIKRTRDSLEGYIPIETFVAETSPIKTDSLDDYPIELAVDGRTIMPQFAIVSTSTPVAVKQIEAGKLSDVLSAPISKDAVHPVTAANWLASLLLGIPLAKSEADREAGLAAAKRVFDQYVIPAKIEVAPGAVAWPNTYDFPVPWGNVMKAPWYSGYSNGVMAANAALMFHFTGDQQYADIARQAVAWMQLPSSKGGGLYHDGPFSFVAEYPSTAPQQPNIRILDGEMIATVSVYNTAVMLGDSEMLQFAATLAYSLASQIEDFTTTDDRIQNGRYQWLVESPSYVGPMKRWALQLGMITKDERFFEAAKRWRKSDVYWPG